MRAWRINRKLQQQKEKLKKGKQKLQKVQEKVHDSMNGDKNYKKKTETQNKWQLHKRNRNEEKIKVTGVLTRKIANLHQKRCLQQADSNTRPARNYVTKNLGPANSARVTLRQQRREEGTEKREEKSTRSRRTKPN